ncbi:AAA family ATPase, partial [Rhodovulum sulfidophilum]|nr:AAA family ATPase [Rhodovulum sulfidophilum]
MAGGSRIGPWTSENLAAAAIPGPAEDAPQEYRNILCNKEPDYRRDPPLALLNAADVSEPGGFSRAGSWTHIKMSEPTIDGLRQAFLAADSRIRLSSQALDDDSTEIAAIAWDGGFLDGQAIRFNNGLNVLVGGRGAGKSLVIESLRYAMDAPVAGTLARGNHEALTKKVLGPSTKVSVLLRDAPPSSRWYIVERTGSAKPAVRGSDGTVIPGLDPMSLVEGLEIYGQHELSELTRDKKLLAKLLSRYIQQQDGGAATHARFHSDLSESRDDIEMCLDAIDRLEGEVGSLPKLRHQLEKMDELGARRMLQEKISFQETVDACLARKTALEELQSRVKKLADDLRGLRMDHPDEDGRNTMAHIGKIGGNQADNLVETINRGIDDIKVRLSELEAERPGLE